MSNQSIKKPSLSDLFNKLKRRNTNPTVSQNETGSNIKEVSSESDLKNSKLGGRKDSFEKNKKRLNYNKEIKIEERKIEFVENEKKVIIVKEDIKTENKN